MSIIFLLNSYSYSAQRQIEPFINFLDQKNINFRIAFYDKNNFIDLNSKSEIKNVFFDTVIIDSRGCFNKMKRNRISTRNLIWRVRGIWPEELITRHPIAGPIFKPIALKKEKNFMEKCNSIWFVSKNMKEHYVDLFKLNPEKIGLRVIPNVFLKNQYNSPSNNGKGICYSGGLSKWQEIEKIKILLLELQKSKLNTGIFVPKDYLERAKVFFKPLPIMTVSSNELEHYLKEFSAGIIIRKDSIINKVSSPFKVVDYIKAGLKVILIGDIGDWSIVANEYKGMFLHITYFEFISNFSKVLNKILLFLETEISEEEFLKWVDNYSIESFENIIINDLQTNK